MNQSSDSPLQSELRPKFVLYVWPSEWSAESLDPECLCAMTFLKFSQIDHEVVEVKASFQLFKNEYPRLEVNGAETHIGLENIIRCIKKEKNIDTLLSNNNYADMFAMLNLFKEKFIPAFNSLCWLDEDNTYTVIRRAYGRHVGFPLNIIKLKLMAHQIESSLMNNYRSSHLKLDNLKPHLLIDAKECISTISDKLGQNLFMFENRPSLIDAYLYGYLNILLKAPFIGSPLKTHLNSSTSLRSLLSRVQKDFFAPKDSTASIKQSKIEPNNETPTLSSTNQQLQQQQQQHHWYSSLFEFLFFDDKDEQAEQRKQTLMAVSVGVLAIITYAFASGFVQVHLIRKRIHYFE